MHATIRRYEGVDESRTDELVKNVDENLLPRLTKMPGFKRYYLIEAGNGVMSSDRLLRDLGAVRRVDARRSNVGARREAREGTPESAEDHGRRGHRSEDERPRSGVIPDRCQGRSASAGLPSTSTGRSGTTLC